MARFRTPQTTRVPLPHEFPAWGVDVFESHHADDWRMDLTRHEFLKLVYVVQGAGVLHSAAGDRAELRLGDLAIVPSGLEHRLADQEGQPMSLYVVSIRPEILQIAALDAHVLPVGRIELEKLASTRIETTIRRLLFEQTLAPSIAGPRVVGLALRMLAELVRCDSRSGQSPSSSYGRDAGTERDSTSRMRAYVDELQEHFFEATNLDTAATSLGLSRRRFTQLFREVTGSSWLNYVRRLRVEHAKRLLGQTDRTVLSIAFECGFEDLSTFYRTFKREVGMSPNQWRSGDPMARETRNADDDEPAQPSPERTHSFPG